MPKILTKSRPTPRTATDSDRQKPATASCCAFPSELGAIGLAWRGDSLTGISIGHASEAEALAVHASRGALAAGDPPEFILQLAERLQRYAAGEADDFRDVPLDLSHLSPFQKRVVERCRRIAAGRTRTYGELAALAGSPGAARAVGNVMAQNRFPIIIPCHRVVGSAGSLGGFSAPRGTSLKVAMLTLEGALPAKGRLVRKAR